MSGISLAALFLGVLPAHAYVITYDLNGSLGLPPTYVANADTFLITDTFDYYSFIRWRIQSVEQQDDGTIRAQWSWVTEGWDGGESYLSGRFEILPESGGDDIEPVMVDAWAAVYLEWDRVEHPPITSVYGPIGVNFRSPFGNMYAGPGPGSHGNYLSGHESDYFFGTYELLTNTPYSIWYDSFFYVETNIEYAWWSSWDDFHLFADTYGYSGETYNRIRGFLQHGFMVRSVPEPGTVALLGLGLASIGFARRRKRKLPSHGGS